MKILRSALGNSQEAFVEKSYSDGVNVISSDDNNKGKTIVIQSLMYALGNEPTFPTSFDYKEYSHYVAFEHEGIEYKLCRHHNGFVLKYNSILMIFDSVSELKRYWTKHISHFPEIMKNQITMIVDPVLYFQLFFVGQDKKDSSNIAHAGLYNKQDFYQMLYDIYEVSGIDLDEEEVKQIKDNIKKEKEEKELVLKQYRILKTQKLPLSYLSSTNDRLAFGKKVAAMEKVRSKIEELRKSRNRATTRKSKWDTTLKELRSLNRTLDCGELRCMDCNSTNILFSNSTKSYSFDVSTVEMRNEIIESIVSQSEAYKEEIDRISAEISDAQDELQTLMEDEEVTLESIVAFKNELFTITDAEARIEEIEERIALLEAKLKAATKNADSKKELQESLIQSIIDSMNYYYKCIDPSGNLEFQDIFTKRDEVFSGSEATIFHIVKLLTFKKIFKHSWPIIIDSFRAEDLSTQKEDIVLRLFEAIEGQSILTTTLKTEEMGKYDDMPNIHHIDYRQHQPSKILSTEYVTEFSEFLGELSLSV